MWWYMEHYQGQPRLHPGCRLHCEYVPPQRSLPRPVVDLVFSSKVWISPVSQNYEGPRTPYGDPYHGYWIADATQLNSKFGTADDLKALSDELHRRGMYASFPRRPHIAAEYSPDTSLGTSWSTSS